ncbi:rab proteins geranylgeranyltransferase component A 1-like [Solea senegalensis]|uniref:Rab proteins geranylgeranyltransferase component A n=1 Tax=Solea senegalensis TaxID=28829 RepID=A0AAV6SF62_SOLSE|nr:rab proteins geranylgeranyltransferase component A 1 isoform X1 [Solea senegalensis]KAG7516044.1 rab proteins geranylgeranyltransferase component A 1-like [Solea senegalensis]
MAAEGLPCEFDVVILGTGLVESVVAAACSRVGQRVLHLDRRSYYAANWASFTFNGLLDWIQRRQEPPPQPDELQDWSSLLEEGEELIYLCNADSSSVSNVQVFSFTREEEESVSPPSTTEEEEAAAAAEVEEAEEETTQSTDIKEKESKEETFNEEDDGQAAGVDGEEHEAPPPDNQSRKKVSYSELLDKGRRFNIDLVSKLMFSRGSLIDLLIKSNVSRYAEFKNVSRILTCRHGNVEQVPCSRADVFGSRQLSVVEKRKLMRFLTSVVEETEQQTAYSGRPYLDFLCEQQLGDNLQHFLLHSIAMVTEDTPTEEGLASTRHFLRCLGRYGNTPFLFPVYGLGEIPQCFCRMSAVFGGIYCLRHTVHCLLLDKSNNRCKAVIDSRGQRISCSHFVVEEGYVATERKKVVTPTRSISRAVLITDASVLPAHSDQQVSLVTVPPVAAGAPVVKMVELCSSTMTCIPGTYLVHLTCQSVGSAYEDLSPVVTRMFNTPESHDQETCPSVLWCLYFNMVDGSGVQVQGHDLPPNVYVCSGPDGGLGHEHAVTQAESIFRNILPDEEFCPPAPNPEDIIYDGDSAPSTGEEEKQGEEKGEEEAGQSERGEGTGVEEVGQSESGEE